MHWIDPNSLPEISGRFERFLLNPHGEADGMILADGAEVHFPPHLGKEVRAAVDEDAKAALRIFGVRPRQGDVFAAVAFETANGVRIVDNGPPKKHEHEKPEKRDAKKARQPMTVEGVVRRVLHGPKGETRGALLEDGRIIRFAPHEAPGLKTLLKCGAALAVRGEGLATALGTVIEAREIGPSAAELRPVKAKTPKPDKPHDKEKHA
jgi:hypothetical protein